LLSDRWSLDMSHLLHLPTVRKSILYEKLPNDLVQCNLCERRCKIPHGGKGFCKTRMNAEGRLYTLVYGDLSALESRPIEIKPFFHYWPGSTALTFSTWSCNFECPWCQNWTLSKTAPEPASSKYSSPEEIVELAVRSGDEGLCASFQEPTLLADWNLDAFRLGRARRLYSCYVSNGYMTPEAMELLWKSGMDGLKVDVKGDAETYMRYCGGTDVGKVWRNIREAKKMGVHIEVVNLIITGVNDDEECLRNVIEQHVKQAGPDAPLHFTRYYPAYRFDSPSTPIKTLEKARDLARGLGISYAYIGNAPGHVYENTFCPRCGSTLIKRQGFKTIRYRVTDEKRCPKCGCQINVRGEHIRKPYEQT